MTGAALDVLAVGAALVALALLANRRRTVLAEAQQQGAGALAWLSLDNVAEEGAAIVSRGLPENASRNLAAFLAMIRHAEGTARHADPYRVGFGGVRFESLADHPRRAVQFTDGAGRRLWTSAAGAYQFLARSPLTDGSGRFTTVDTWDRLRRKLALPDFGPASQDRAATELIDEAGALADVYAGRFDVAVDKVRRTWASLPGAGHAQPERSRVWIRAAYLAAGGAFT